MYICHRFARSFDIENFLLLLYQNRTQVQGLICPTRKKPVFS
ncbi:hypothetical protein NT05LI_3076, partial [Listeria ivanovii FSL F6-596]